MRFKLGHILTAIFVFALFMGPGPGLHLVNPETQGEVALLGVPVLYLWCVFWFLVEAAVIIAAYLTVWKDD